MKEKTLPFQVDWETDEFPFASLREYQLLPWKIKPVLEKGMATHSNILAQRIPWTEEAGELQSMGSHRVRHD